MLKYIYILFLGLILATFVGVGIATFYPAPQYPETPAVLQKRVEEPLTQEQKVQEDKYIEDQEKYQSEFKVYNRNVSIVALIFAITFLVISLVLANKIDILSDGLLLGGVFTLLYSIIRGFMSEETTYRFIVVSVGLVVALVLGYIKFIKPKS